MQKPFAAFLVAAAVVTLCAALGLAAYAGTPLVDLFIEADILAKMVLMLLAPMLVAVLALSVAVLAARASSGVPFLNLIVLLALGLGALGAALRGLTIWQIVGDLGATPSLHVMAPSIAEAVLQLGVGLLVAAIAALPGALLPPPRPAVA